MKKSISTGILIIFMLASFVLLAYPSCVLAVTKWKVVTVWVPSLSLIKNDQYFVKLVNELCKGELEMKLYSAGQIVPSFEVFDAVRTGTVQAGCDWAGYWAGKNSAFAAVATLPFGPGQMDFMTWIHQGGGKEIAQEIYGKYDMKYLYHVCISSESGIRGQKTLTTVDDFKGMKIRISGLLQGKVIKDLGAVQVMLAGQEVYQALEKGVVDAAEFSSPDIDWSLGFQDITTIWNAPGWHQPGGPAGIMFNKKAWNALPKSVQRKIEIAADATMCWAMARHNLESGIYTKKFLDKGIKVNQLSDAALKKIQALSFKHMVEEAQKNPLFAKVVYSLFKTMQTIAPWREIEKGLMGKTIELPDMEALRKAAKLEK